MVYSETMLEPWDHQREAMPFLLEKNKVALFACMGTGKSKLAIDRITAKKPNSTLIVCPRKAIRVWKKEFDKHSYLYNTDDIVISATKEGNSEVQAEAHFNVYQVAKPSVIIMNYAMLYQQPMWEFLKYVDFEHIILDESHRIKSHDSQASRKLFQIGKDCSDKLILTGTPMDRPHDIWAQFRFLNHKILGTSYTNFKDEYCIETGKGFRKKITGYQNLDELYDIIDKYSYRIKASVLDLPELIEMDRYATMGDGAQEKYNGISQQLRGLFKKDRNNVDESQMRQLIMEARRLSSGFVNDELLFNHKISLLEDTISTIPEEDNLVVFSYFHSAMDEIKQILEKMDYKCGEISGRKDNREEFEQDKLDSLVIQIQAGSEAINCLTKANWGIFFAPTYSYLQYAQARKRLHRPGQEETVRLIRLITEDSIEEQMLSIIKEKSNLTDYLLDKH